MAVIGYIEDGKGGKRCPTEICKAVCCRSSHFRPDRKPPCEYLQLDLKCELHKVGGMACKPKGCADFPSNQADIDAINRQAERAGFKERCQLKVT